MGGGGQGLRTAMNDPRTRLVVLLLGAPQVLESRERGEDGTTDPDRVFTFGRGDDLDLYIAQSLLANEHEGERTVTDLHARWGERCELLLHTISDTREHGGSAGKDDVAIEVPTNIEITLEDGVVAVHVLR